MTKEQIHHAIDSAYSIFESTLTDLAKVESVRADEIKAEIEWLKWRQRHLKATKPLAFLKRAAQEIEEYATEVQCSIRHTGNVFEN